MAFSAGHYAISNRGDDAPHRLNLPKFWQMILLTVGHGLGEANMGVPKFSLTYSFKT